MNAQDVKTVFCQIRLTNGKCLANGSFYRPPNLMSNTIKSLSSTMETIACDHMIIGGDFNLPAIAWNNENFRGATGGELYRVFQLIGRFFVGTRIDDMGNILDVLLCNTSGIVENMHTVPGIRHHKATVSEVRANHVNEWHLFMTEQVTEK